MEQRIIASYRESIKQEVSEALKPLESRIDELLQIKSKTDRISGEMCRGITRIHRSPSRPRPAVRPTAAFINIHEHPL